MEYGFNTYAGFYKVFYREYGLSPSEYLKTYQPSYPYKIDLLQEGKLMISKKIMKRLLVNWGMEECPISNVYYEGSLFQFLNFFLTTNCITHIIQLKELYYTTNTV